MAEFCQVCGRADGCRSYTLAGDYPVLLCHPCVNIVIPAMHKMPEFREWFVCERSMDAAAVAGLSADEIRKRAAEYFAAAARLREVVSAMVGKLSVFKNEVLPKLKPSAPPLSKEDAEIIQHEVDQLPPVKPATVYALAFSEWFNRESGRVPGDVKLCGVYASREVMEKAKAKFIEDDACRAKIDGRPRQTFTWYAWEGQPMGGEEPANG